MRTVPCAYNPVHHPDVFGEASAGRFESRRASDFLVGLALRKSFVPAVIALAARDVMKHHHPIARLKLAHALRPRPQPRPQSRARKCAARNASRWQSSSDRCRRFRRCARAPAIRRPDLGHRNGFQANIVHAAIHRRLHGGGNRLPVLSSIANCPGIAIHASPGPQRLDAIPTSEFDQCLPDRGCIGPATRTARSRPWRCYRPTEYTRRQSQGRIATNATNAAVRKLSIAGDKSIDGRHFKIGFVGDGFEPDESDAMRLRSASHRRRFHVDRVRPVGFRQLGFLLDAGGMVNADQNPVPDAGFDPASIFRVDDANGSQHRARL